MKFKGYVLLISISGVLLLTNSCQQDQDQICSNSCNIDQFNDNLLAALDGQVMCYAHIISENGQAAYIVADGLGRNATECQKDMSVNNRMHVASVSKCITTVAALAVLDFKNIDVTALVEPYLLQQWSRGPGISSLTFFDILSQQSGLNQFGSQNFNATRYDSLQLIIAAGATGPKVKKYSNTNHGLMRIILPRLWDKFRPADGNYDEDFCTSNYIACVQEFIFDPLGIASASAISPFDNPNLAYASSNDNGLGGTTDFSNVLGGTGWHMSVTQLATFFAFLWNTESLIDVSDLQWMQDNTAGFWNSTTGQYGTYYCKLGGWGYGVGTAFNACLMKFPNDVQVTIIVNSPHTSGNSLRTIAVNAYDDAESC